MAQYELGLGKVVLLGHDEALGSPYDDVVVEGIVSVLAAIGR